MTEDANTTEQTDQAGAQPEAGSPDTDQPALDAERIEELVAAARADDLELPVGAEDFALALRAVAGERDDLKDRFARTAADYTNFQRRAANNEREARQLAAGGVVQSVLTIVDYFDYALKQDPETATVQQVIGGVEMIKSELIRVLGNHGVQPIAPEPNAEFDPLKHEAVEHAEADDVEPGHVARCIGAGYMLGDRVVRPAKVAVAKASGGGADTEATDANV